MRGFIVHFQHALYEDRWIQCFIGDTLAVAVDVVFAFIAEDQEYKFDRMYCIVSPDSNIIAYFI